MTQMATHNTDVHMGVGSSGSKHEPRLVRTTKVKIHNRHQYSKALVQLARAEEEERSDDWLGNRVALTQHIMDLQRALRIWRHGHEQGTTNTN